MGVVYAARNTVNGKVYIGKTVTTLKRRKAWHLAAAGRGDGWYFHQAIRKYGPEAFSWGVLFESDDQDELFRMEIKFIADCGTKRPGGYNLTDGGDGVAGLTPEAMARIVAFHTGRKRSAETRRRQSEAAKGKKKRLGAVLSEETKRKIAARLVGRNLTEAHKSSIGDAFRGKPKTPEQKAKMSAARKHWWLARRKPGVVEDILRGLAAGESGSSLARKHGISDSAVSRIKRSRQALANLASLGNGPREEDSPTLFGAEG